MLLYIMGFIDRDVRGVYPRVYGWGTGGMHVFLDDSKINGGDSAPQLGISSIRDLALL